MGRIVKIPALVLLEICHCLLLVLGASYLSDSFLRTEIPSPLSKWISQKCSSVFLKLQNQIYDTYMYTFYILKSFERGSWLVLQEMEVQQPHTCGFPFKFSISCKSAKSRRSSIGLKKVRASDLGGWEWVQLVAITQAISSLDQLTTTYPAAASTSYSLSSLFGQCAKVGQENQKSAGSIWSQSCPPLQFDLFRSLSTSSTFLRMSVRPSFNGP